MQSSKHWLKELSEDLSSIKKIQSETKDTLIEIKDNIQRNKNRMDKAENQINDLEHKEEKQPVRTRRKKDSKENEASKSNLWNNFKYSNIAL